MKLSNLSLAVLVALGVAACGGSDDNNNAPQDPPPGNGGGNNGGGNTTPPPADNSQKPQDPARVAPGMDVQDAVKPHVQTAKTTYAAAGARDLLTGYAPNAGIVGSAGNATTPYGAQVAALNLNRDPLLNDASVYVGRSTDAANVKRLSSMVNYVETAQLRSDSANPIHNGAVLANPGFTYALGNNGLYYRMQPEPGVMWHTTTPNTRYVPVGTAADADGVTPDGRFAGGSVGQDQLVFIPNVTITTNAALAVTGTAGGLNIDGTPGGVDRINSTNFTSANSPFSSTDAAPAAGGTGDLLAGQRAQPFTVDNGLVIFKTAEFNGVTYDISTSGKIEKVDLNTIPVKKEIQYLPVKINYDTKDTKGTGTLVDDTVISRSADAGAMKAYNLPYSLAFVTVNEAGADKMRMTAGAAARNFFDYSTSGTLGDLGAYQVVGYQSPYLPRNGRADYVGQSFGVDSKGDVKLRADFGATGAHIGGSVTNRTYADGTGTLPEITLANIQLSAPGTRLNTTGTGLFGNAADTGAARSRNNAGRWDVQLFGPDAEEAGGVIQFFNGATALDAVIPGGVEVFTSQRGVITQDSNIAPTP